MKKLVFQSDHFFFSCGGAQLILFELGCDEPFGVCKSLSSLGVRDELVSLSATHFDVVAKDPCESNLERFDAGFFA